MTHPLPYLQSFDAPPDPALMRTLAPILKTIATTPDAATGAILRSCTSEDLGEIETVAGLLRRQCTHLLVIGSGGSGLSTRTLAALQPPHSNEAIRLHVIDHTDPIAAGSLLRSLPLAKTGVLLISKSGHTVETLGIAAVLFSIAQENGQEIAPRCLAITAPGDNPLRRLALAKKVRILDHDSDLCGRFSVLSKVGLLPAAVLGIDIRALHRGARQVITTLQASDGESCEPARGAAMQAQAMKSGRSISVMMVYGEALAGLAPWYRQGWAESLGKSGGGSTPYASFGPGDQHSQLQLYLGGPRDKCFTLVLPQSHGAGEIISLPEQIRDEVSFLHGRTLGDVMAAQQRATYESLKSHALPVRRFEVPRPDAEALGALLMHFMLEIILTAALLGINPFDQPAVEESKKNARRYLAEMKG